MGKELIINASLPEVRLALMEEGKIQELIIERSTERGIVGNIYKGRVTRVLPGMQAAFVDIGLEKAAFLYVDDIFVHPKVMGEETEVMDQDDDSEELSLESQGSDRDFGGDSELLESSARDDSSDADIQEADLGEDESPEELLNDHDIRGQSGDGFSSSDTPDSRSPFVEPALEHEVSLQSAPETDQNFIERTDHHESSLSGEGSPSVSEEFMESEKDFSDEGGEHGEEGEDSGEFVESGEPSAENDGATAKSAPLKGLQQQGGGRFRRGRHRRGQGRDRQRQNRFPQGQATQDIPEAMHAGINETHQYESDRSSMDGEGAVKRESREQKRDRPEFRENRGKDRRIKSKSMRPKATANIADLLKEGQEVIVQVSKDPIAAKGARLTCHVSLPGRHIVCMPTIDHVGVSRRIEREDERRKLRDFVERNRPKKMGFIVRTASGGKDPESWIKQDIDYLSRIWREVRTKADEVSAPAQLYEDLNVVLRAIRDWVNEDIEKIIVDSRYHFHELKQFAERFMPGLLDKIELYQGDIPVFDAYGISAELHRSLERKVWLKSGGYIVIDQAEALVAIDVNTGRFVGKKSLEDTILKTNLEAAEEIAYQLRLRNCGGIIIVDFIDMEREENRMRVYRALDEVLKKDRVRPTIQKISDLGLVEMTRKRTRDTIIRTLCEPCSHCEGKGFLKNKATVAYEVLREIERFGVDRDSKKILVSAHQTVIEMLAVDFKEVLDQLERRFNKTIYLQEIDQYHEEQFEVVSDRSGVNKAKHQDVARQLRVERDRGGRRDKRQQPKKEWKPQQRKDQPKRDVGRDHPMNPMIVQSPQEQISEVPGADAPSEWPVSKPSTEETQETQKEESQNMSSYSKDSQRGGYVPQRQHQKPALKTEEEMEREDQLAYLRAQAAQDMALAKLNAGVSPSMGGRSPGNSSGQGNGRQRFQNSNRESGGPRPSRTPSAPAQKKAPRFNPQTGYVPQAQRAQNQGTGILIAASPAPTETTETVQQESRGDIGSVEKSSTES